MNNIFKGLIHQEIVMVKDNNLFAKAKKCFFKQKRLAYLSMIISKNHIEMDPAKVSNVLD